MENVAKRYDQEVRENENAQVGSLNRSGIILGRFSPLVRKGIQYRSRFEDAKRSIGPVPFEWYRYDSFANLFYIQHLMRRSAASLEELVGNDPVLDIGAADGALSFFWESLGYCVHAIDYSGTNINRLEGLRRLAAYLDSKLEIQDTDLDGRFELTSRYGLAFFLGTLYHLKNPFYVLELLAQHALYCFLSTRVARVSVDGRTRLDGAPLAYLLESAECNEDATNYFVFSPTGLMLLAKRAGWIVRGALSSGGIDSDPISRQGDERMFLLLQSATLQPKQ
jgi:tRNA (mo5U34)-methyltransferase